MKNSKVRTIGKTGNYVRFLIGSIIFIMVAISCQKIDTGSDDPRDNLLGKWSCSEDGQIFGHQNYEVEITKSSNDSTKIFISGFYLGNGALEIYANLKNLNLTIPSQTVDGYQISGNGIVSSNYRTINWTYTVISGSETDHLTAVYTKQ
ncbi:MAG TPA: hypothetical protein VIH57_02625 [Bacteroidales bacterium]